MNTPMKVPALASRIWSLHIDVSTRTRFYVAQLPGDGGKDWGYTTDRTKAIRISPYWQRRFRADTARESSALAETVRFDGDWTCPKCGRVYEELHLDPMPPWLGAGCVDGDCPGQLGASEEMTEVEYERDQRERARPSAGEFGEDL